MTKFNSVKKNNDFKIIYKNGKVKANNLLVMYVINKENISLDDKDNIMYPLIKDKNNREKNRIGISASKKIGNSVVRHRVTRLLRECFRLNEKKFKYKADIVVVAKKEIYGKEYKEVLSAFLNLCKRHELI